ncbi:UNVERIFIED_CONTAM: hypothetical protein Slati_2205000 [Sesamum latifolium]|uniref:Reverse transcriptase domain-containing protein n=1 Tax=Sesamum latifolium TaxID=2727402 RepID=A0AAW2WTE8_9LAMI
MSFKLKGFLDTIQRLMETDHSNDLLILLERMARLVLLKATLLEQKGRRAAQKIFQITSDSGARISDELGVAGEFVRFYTSLLGGQSRHHHINLMFLQAWARYVIPTEEGEAMTRPIISRGGRPSSILLRIRHQVQMGKLLKQVNATVLSLIPKVANPTTVAEFRPISCCNNAFVPGRRISNNILLGQELFHGYNRQHLPPRCALKVDLRKAYDTLEWDFVEAMLHMFAFPGKFIQWIMECAASSFVATIEQSASFQFHWHCEEMKLFNLCFADDLLLFCRAEEQSVTLFRDVLHEFADFSGLHANINKSQLILSKSASSMRNRLLAILGFQEGHLPVRYLGLPLISSRLSIDDCKPLLLKGVLKAVEARMRKFLWQGGWDSGAVKVALILGDLDHQISPPLFSLDSSGGGGSWSWRKILKLRHQLMGGVSYHVGSDWLPPLARSDLIGWKKEGGVLTTTEAYRLFQPLGQKERLRHTHTSSFGVNSPGYASGSWKGRCDFEFLILVGNILLCGRQGDGRGSTRGMLPLVLFLPPLFIIFGWSVTSGVWERFYYSGKLVFA